MANSEGGFQTSRWFYLTLAIFAFGVIIACFVSNAFVNTSSAYVNMDVQPADFCFFAIWAILYIFQVCLLAYGAIYLFRKDSENVLIFKKINHIHYSFYLLMTLSYIADIIWSWTNWSPIGNFITLFFMAMPQWIIFTISMYALSKQLDSMKEFDMRPDIVLIRLLIQNGCAAWATWHTIGFVMGFANLLTNCGGVDGTVASTISLSFILTLLVVYFILDLIIYTTLFIFQYTTYLTVTWTFIGVLAKNVASTVGLTRNNILSIVILCTALVLLFIKLIIPLIFFDKIKPSTADPRVPRSATAKRRRAQQQQGTNTAGPSREPTGVWHY